MFRERSEHNLGPIVQLGERLVRNQEVGGSSPPRSTRFLVRTIEKLSRFILIALLAKREPKLRRKSELRIKALKTIIKGQNYNFYIIADGAEFYIEAIHLVSLRFSFINNLNTVLSELNIDVYDKKVSESQWLVSKRQSRLFFKKAINFLSGKNYCDYIERKLDKDRECGEWENYE